MKPATFLALLAIAAIGSTATSCSKDGSGSGGSPGTTSTVASGSLMVSSASTTMQCGDIGFDQASCGPCASERCCDALDACKTGTACRDLRTCSDACAKGDPECVTLCQTNFAAGAAPLVAMNQCLAEECAMDCGGGGIDEVCDSTILYGNAQCAECLTDNCCLQYEECAAVDPDACARCLNGDDTCDASGVAAVTCHASCTAECGSVVGTGTGTGGGGSSP